jgi:hypothetical protein
MNRTQLVRMALALAAALGLWGVLAVARRPTEDRGAALALPKVDSAGVDTIAVTRATDTVILARGARGQWRANGYPAAQAAVTDLFRALADTSRWSDVVAERRTSHARLGVTADSGQRLRVVSHGKALVDAITGKRTSDGGGVFLRRTTDDAVYAVHGPLADALGRAPDDWRDKHIASVTADSVAAIEVQRGTSSYKLERSGTRWMLGAGRPADSAAVAGLLGEYANVTASGFATRAQADSIDFTRPRARARVLSKGGSPLVSLLFDSTASGVWTRADSGGPVFKIEAWTLGTLAPAESTLRAKKATKR